MEIAMKFNGTSYSTSGNTRNSVSVCAELLRKEIFLPSDTPKIYAVFTEKKVPNAFRIEPPDEFGYSEIAGIATYILSWTRETLGRAYGKGLRYVHIEY